jgi:hypothetical protein
MPRKKKENPKPVGNPQKNIDWVKVDDLLIKGCNGVEIAERIGVHPDTLYDRCLLEKSTDWSAYLQSKRARGNSFLREKQYHKAIVEGNTTILLHLFKHRLGEWDKVPEQEASEEKENQFKALMHLLSEIQSSEARKSSSINIREERKS